MSGPPLQGSMTNSMVSCRSLSSRSSSPLRGLSPATQVDRSRSQPSVSPSLLTSSIFMSPLGSTLSDGPSSQCSASLLGATDQSIRGAPDRSIVSDHHDDASINGYSMSPSRTNAQLASTAEQLHGFCSHPLYKDDQPRGQFGRAEVYALNCDGTILSMVPCNDSIMHCFSSSSMYVPSSKANFNALSTHQDDGSPSPVSSTRSYGPSCTPTFGAPSMATQTPSSFPSLGTVLMAGTTPSSRTSKNKTYSGTPRYSSRIAKLNSELGKVDPSKGQYSKAPPGDSPGADDANIADSSKTGIDDDSKRSSGDDTVQVPAGDSRSSNDPLREVSNPIEQSHTDDDPDASPAHPGKTTSTDINQDENSKHSPILPANLVVPPASGSTSTGVYSHLPGVPMPPSIGLPHQPGASLSDPKGPYPIPVDPFASGVYPQPPQGASNFRWGYIPGPHGHLSLVPYSVAASPVMVPSMPDAINVDTVYNDNEGLKQSTLRGSLPSDQQVPCGGGSKGSRHSSSSHSKASRNGKGLLAILLVLTLELLVMGEPMVLAPAILGVPTLGMGMLLALATLGDLALSLLGKEAFHLDDMTLSDLPSTSRTVSLSGLYLVLDMVVKIIASTNLLIPCRTRISMKDYDVARSIAEKKPLRPVFKGEGDLRSGSTIVREIDSVLEGHDAVTRYLWASSNIEPSTWRKLIKGMPPPAKCYLDYERHLDHLRGRIRSLYDNDDAIAKAKVNFVMCEQSKSETLSDYVKRLEAIVTELHLMGIMTYEYDMKRRLYDGLQSDDLRDKVDRELGDGNVSFDDFVDLLTGFERRRLGRVQRQVLYDQMAKSHLNSKDETEAAAGSTSDKNPKSKSSNQNTSRRGLPTHRINTIVDKLGDDASDSFDAHVYAVGADSMSIQCYRCLGSGHPARLCRGKIIPDKALYCQRCRRKGHLPYVCPADQPVQDTDSKTSKKSSRRPTKQQSKPNGKGPSPSAPSTPPANAKVSNNKTTAHLVSNKGSDSYIRVSAANGPDLQLPQSH
ncbi:hypothetical protein FOZ60_016961, partial [Perkinsus olseni]